MKPGMSVFKAIMIGLAVVNGPVLLLLLAPFAIFIELVKRGFVPRAYGWAAPIILLAGFIVAWLWWSVSMPKWRLWALERVSDVASLKRRAVSVGLTWPDGHPLARTEIKSRAHAQRENELDPAARNDPRE